MMMMVAEIRSGKGGSNMAEVEGLGGDEWGWLCEAAGSGGGGRWGATGHAPNIMILTQFTAN